MDVIECLMGISPRPMHVLLAFGRERKRPPVFHDNAFRTL